MSRAACRQGLLCKVLSSDARERLPLIALFPRSEFDADCVRYFKMSGHETFFLSDSSIMSIIIALKGFHASLAASELGT